MKSKKTVILILILTITSYILLGFTPLNFYYTYAADKSAGTLDPNIDAIDDGIYPGYKSLIKSMQARHSNYRFLVYYPCNHLPNIVLLLLHNIMLIMKILLT